MRVTEVSAIDCLRSAMQVLIDAWGERRARLGLSTSADDVDSQRLVLRALAVASRWTCVQWGCDAGWWSKNETDRARLRNVGLSRLSDWAAALEYSELADCAPAPVVQGEMVYGEDSDAAVAERAWYWVTGTCERVREQPDAGFEALIATFELALQIIPEVRGGHVTLRLGKANSAHSRRKSGSYYTPHRIVDSMLEQTLERALDEQQTDDASAFALRVLDPACGAGLFLVAAAKRITARRLGHSGSGVSLGDEPAYTAAFVRTVEENIFGVDSNPLAIAWCRLWLWSCAGAHDLEIATFAPGLRVGNAIVGAPSDAWRGAPSDAWKPTAADDKTEARRLKARHSREVAANCLTSEPAGALRRSLADGWCAAFFWSKVVSAPDGEDVAPTYASVLQMAECGSVAQVAGDTSELAAEVQRLARRVRFFHWSIEFADVLEAGGFDVVIGNPPWIAHAGRAAQALDPHLKHYFLCNYGSFNGYPTTHGLFVERAASLMKVGARLGFVLPASVSELGGYEAVRLAHDRWCDFESDLLDFGEGCFPGVTQPCMGLVSRRREGGRSSGVWGQPWPMSREDLGELGRVLLARLAALPVIEPELFGERGIQSDQRMKAHLSPGSEAHGRFTTPVREGADIREFFLGKPKLWADWSALGPRIRSAEEYTQVRIVVRQTASFPIATLYDGLPFRNSLLAGFGSAQWEPLALVALLNSSLIRWHHYMRHRDARQPVLPQVKVGHLRAIPRPVAVTEAHKRELARLAAATDGETSAVERSALDQLVAEMYGLSEDESALVRAWAEPLLTKARRKAGSELSAER